jgi:hypothetical protein
MNALLALSGLRKIIKYISSEHAFLQITVYPSMPAFFWSGGRCAWINADYSPQNNVVAVFTEFA